MALPGATLVFKATSGRSSGDYVVVEFTAGPGFAGPRPHVHHTHEELFYVLEGEFDFLVGNGTVRVGPGSFVNVPPGLVHDFRNSGSAPARWLGTVSPGGLEHYLDEILALVENGQFSEAALRELRLRYDSRTRQGAGWALVDESVIERFFEVSSLRPSSQHDPRAGLINDRLRDKTIA